MSNLLNIKREFLKFYLSYHPKITTHFDRELFINRNDILLVSGKKMLKEFLEFYCPWHYKEGKINPSIEEVLKDPHYRTAKLKQISQFPEKMQEARAKSGKLPKDMWEVPIAIDLEYNKALILDSNKTLSVLAQDESRMDDEIKVIEIRGKKLKEIIIDFAVITRG